MPIITVTFEVKDVTDFEAWLRVNRVFSSLSLPEGVNILEVETEATRKADH